MSVKKYTILFMYNGLFKAALSVVTESDFL